MADRTFSEITPLTYFEVAMDKRPSVSMWIIRLSNTLGTLLYSVFLFYRRCCCCSCCVRTSFLFVELLSTWRCRGASLPGQYIIEAQYTQSFYKREEWSEFLCCCCYCSWLCLLFKLALKRPLGNERCHAKFIQWRHFDYWACLLAKMEN